MEDVTETRARHDIYDAESDVAQVDIYMYCVHV